MDSNMSEAVHHKMSKKIAQLTKVIFHLHSKNEENGAMQTAISNAYEKEIETILRDANGLIGKQKEALNRAIEGNNFKEKLKEIEAGHLQEKMDSQQEFKDYKAKLA